jgi:hypothetical protein
MKKYNYDTNFYDFTKKDEVTRDSVELMLNKCLSMFRWENLPDTIPQRSLELFLQTTGNCVFAKSPNDELCIYTGGLGGEPDYLYRPTLYTVANPAQNFSKSFNINDLDENQDAVLVRNDPLMRGMLTIHRKYATQETENLLTLWLTDINARMPFLLSAQDENTRKSAQDFLDSIVKGKLGVITDSAFLEGIKAQQLSSEMHMLITGLIQYQEYIHAEWLHEIGINALKNGTKKEAISDAEENASTDELILLPQVMLEERQKAVEQINKLFGTDISVSLNSSWEDNVEEIELSHEVMEAEAEQIVEQDEETEEVEDDGEDNAETDE